MACTWTDERATLRPQEIVTRLHRILALVLVRSCSSGSLRIGKGVGSANTVSTHHGVPAPQVLDRESRILQSLRDPSHSTAHESTENPPPQTNTHSRRLERRAASCLRLARSWCCPAPTRQRSFLLPRSPQAFDQLVTLSGLCFRWAGIRYYYY